MNLETIQSMWEKDSHIDPDELHTASLVVPTLHAKYYQLFNDLRLLRAKAKKTYQKVYPVQHLVLESTLSGARSLNSELLQNHPVRNWM